MYGITQVKDKHHVKVRPLIDEGSPFQVSPYPTDRITKEGHYVTRYSDEKYFRMKLEDSFHEETYSQRRDVELYQYEQAYYAVVYDTLVYHIDDPNGHRDVNVDLSKRKQTVLCKQALPERSLFDIELIFY